MTLTPFRMNTCKKNSGEEVLRLTKHPPRMFILSEQGESKDLSSFPIRQSVLPTSRHLQPVDGSLFSERPNLQSFQRFSSVPYLLTSLPPHLLHRRHQLRNVDPNHRAFSRPALYIQMKIRPIEHTQPLAHVAQPDPFDIHVRHLLFRDAHAIVFNLDLQPSVAVRRAQPDPSAPEL